MNKEMLARGKRKDNGRWVEGYYVYHISRTPSPVEGTIKPEDEHHLIFFDGSSDWGLPRDLRCAEVDPSTIGRCTSVTDKYGVQIFGGDIVKTPKYGKDDGHGHNFSGPDTFQVDFEDGGYCLHNKWRRFNLRPDVDVEVIGNIHDNPELMGGEGDG